MFVFNKLCNYIVTRQESKSFPYLIINECYCGLTRTNGYKYKHIISYHGYYTLFLLSYELVDKAEIWFNVNNFIDTLHDYNFAIDHKNNILTINKKYININYDNVYSTINQYKKFCQWIKF